MICIIFRNDDDLFKSNYANCSSRNVLYDITLNTTSRVDVFSSGATYATRRGFIIVTASSNNDSLDIFCRFRENSKFIGFCNRMSFPPNFGDEPLFYFACGDNMVYNFSYQKYSGSDTSKLKIVNIF